MSFFSAINKIIQRKRRKNRFEVIKLTPKERTALATTVGSFTAIALVTAILVIMN